MAALLAKKEREHREKLEQLNRDRDDRMKSLKRDYAKMQEDQPLKWQRAEKTRVQALKSMQDIFDAKIKEMQRDRGKRDAEREAKVKEERDINQLQIMALEARISQYEKDAVDLAARKNGPAVVSVIQALTGAGALAVDFKSGSTAMMASGTGWLTSAASTF
ncbi:hypothetical protein LRP88_01868 [Fusarium phalaenopsidis]